MGKRIELLFVESNSSVKYREKENKYGIVIIELLLFITFHWIFYFVASEVRPFFKYATPVITVIMLILYIMHLYYAKKHRDTPLIISETELKYKDVIIPLNSIKRIRFYKDSLRGIYPYFEYDMSGIPKVFMLRPVRLKDTQRLLNIFQRLGVDIILMGSNKSFKRRGLLID